jgi:LuxR family maltose regulon positive regulatory protein
MLEIRLFGTGQISFQSHRVTDFPTQQPLMLLCYLILHRGHFLSREQISSTFWNDVSNCLARKNLRNVFWRLRQIFQSLGANLADYISVTEDNICFISSDICWLDIDVFEKSILESQDVLAQNLSVEQVAQLEMAIDLYKGDLLESTYEDWCFYQREQMRLFHLNSLSKLLVYHTLKRNFEHAIEIGGKLLALDPLRETTYQQMMWLNYMAGERNAAIMLYERLGHLLQEELGVSPMEETIEIYSQIVSNHFLPRQWPLPFYSHESCNDMTEQIWVKQTFIKLHQLQKMIEQTGNELNALERLISDVKHFSPPIK